MKLCAVSIDSILDPTTQALLPHPILLKLATGRINGDFFMNRDAALSLGVPSQPAPSTVRLSLSNRRG